MKRIAKIGVVIASVLGVFVFLVVRSLGPPSFDDLDLNVLMEPANVPDDALCLNTETKGIKGMELIHPLEGAVVIQGGDKQLAYSEWREFRPELPWFKNQDIKNLYESHCHYRSPGAPAGCMGWDCARYREVSGYTWRALGRLVGAGCYPTGSDGCSGTQAAPGHLAVLLIQKCHIVRVRSPTYELTDPSGNKFVMNAHAAEQPSTDVELPEGWRFDVVERDAPLEVKPFGGGDNCYAVVLNDSRKQFYHQFKDADGVFP